MGLPQSEQPFCRLALLLLCFPLHPPPPSLKPPQLPTSHCCTFPPTPRQAMDSAAQRGKLRKPNAPGAGTAIGAEDVLFLVRKARELGCTLG